MLEKVQKLSDECGAHQILSPLTWRFWQETMAKPLTAGYSNFPVLACLQTAGSCKTLGLAKWCVSLQAGLGLSC